MAYQKLHPWNTWEAEFTMAEGYVNDSKAHLSSLQAQLDECDQKITSAQTVISLLEPGTTRYEKAEISERKRFLNQMQRTKESVQKAFDVVKARLARHKAALKEFPKDELEKEQKLRNAKHNAGSMKTSGDPINVTRSTHGSVSHYGG